MTRKHSKMQAQTFKAKLRKRGEVLLVSAVRRFDSVQPVTQVFLVQTRRLPGLCSTTQQYNGRVKNNEWGSQLRADIHTEGSPSIQKGEGSSKNITFLHKKKQELFSELLLSHSCLQ